jgi:DNA-binding transcriptional MerR regulator
MRYRVDGLAARSGVSVDTVRFYQSQGLLPPPDREGRIAWYSDGHLELLGRIRHLKEQGFNLTSIRRLLRSDLAPDERALVEALEGPAPGPEGVERWLTLDELCDRTGVSPAVLEAIERAGVLVPSQVDGSPRYTASDARAVASGLKLLEAGVPLEQILDLARAHQRAIESIAERAVDVFDAYVRRPLRDGEGAGGERRLVDAFNDMFPATTSLVAHQFGRLLLQAAQRRIERAGAIEPEAARGDENRAS